MGFANFQRAFGLLVNYKFHITSGEIVDSENSDGAEVATHWI